MPQYASQNVFVVSMFLAIGAGAVAGGTVAFVSPYVAHAPLVATSTGSAPEVLVANGEEQDVIRSVKRTSPAVVTITVSRVLPTKTNASSTNAVISSSQSGGRLRLGAGSGFFVSSDGLIVTNRHVVDNKNADYQVTLQNGKTYPGRVLDIDPSLDLAVLKVDVSDAPALEFGDSDGLEVGQTVIAIGNSLAQFQNSVTKGIISGKNRRLLADGLGGTELLEEAIQTDAAINPGNSGGPLLDTKGRVIGVTTAVSEGGRSLGFAIPANAVKQAVQSVKKTGRIIRPWLGVRYFMIDEDVAKENNLSVNYGALVSRGSSPRDVAVVPGSPADKAGIQENDIILEIQNQKLSDERSLATALSRFAPGAEVDVKVLRHGEEKTLKLKLDERASVAR